MLSIQMPIRRRAHSALPSAGLLILSILLLMPVAGHSEPAPKVTADRTEIITKLLAYQFDSLDSELTAYEQKAESDPRFEMNAIIAFAAFDTPMPLIVDRVKDWRKAKPDSYAAALARAISLTATGVRWRGNGWAKDVPDANFAAMNQNVRDAVNAENSALAINPNLASAYALRIRAARLAGSEDEVARAAGEALKRVPASFAVREQMMYAMRPRWGGSRDAMQKLADQSQQYAAQNPSMKFLKAWLPLDIGDDYADQNQWDQAIASYTEALQAGGEYWTTYRRRANAFYSIGNFKEATRDALHANQLFPQNSEVLKLLAMSTAHDDNPEACILWSATYLRFDMPDPVIFAQTQAAAQELKAQGKGSW